MKQRADYLEMQRRMAELERGMKPSNPEYKALAKRMKEVGNGHMEITKTTYWHWLTQKDDFPETYFYNNPPIGQAKESARILITGTRVETSDMYDILKGSEAYQRVMKALSKKQKRLPNSKTTLPLRIPSSPQELSDSKLVQIVAQHEPSSEIQEVKPDYVFTARVGSFWKNFFGEESFLDHPRKISIPCLIFGTGYMRNYSRLGGETINVTERLKEIAIGWDIPIQFIDSWAP